MIYNIVKEPTVEKSSVEVAKELDSKSSQRWESTNLTFDTKNGSLDEYLEKLKSENGVCYGAEAVL